MKIEQIKASGESADVIEKRIAQIEKSMEMYKNPFFKLVITFLEIFPVGLVIALISAAVLRKKKVEGRE